MTAPVAVGIDVGGTHLRAGLVGPEGLIGSMLRRRSEVDDADALVAGIVSILGDVAVGQASLLPVGLGMAGLIDRDGRLRYGPNVGVRELPLAERLRAELGAERRIRVVNDGAAAVVGEHRVGAARGHRDVVMLTLGTGVGGGIVVDGRLLEGAGGFAGELGHLIIEEGGRDAPSGVRGTVEAYASGAAIAWEADEACAAGAPGARPEDAVGVVAAAEAGEPWARAVLERVGDRLGVAIASVVAVVDPSIVVVGGGAGDAASEFLLPAARRSFVANMMGAAYRPVPPVVPAALGDDAGVIGAGLLAADLGSEA
jgi:glucokinase